MNDNDLLLIQAYIDGELDAASALAFEQRLAANQTLAETCDYYRTIQQATRRLPAAEVSSSLRARIDTARSPAAYSRRQLAAAIAGAIILSAGVTRYALSPDAMSLEADDAATAHRRAMLATLPFDVASSDRHTVKPWLAARLGFSPPTADLTDQGYTLAGGRVDVIAGKPVPALVYRYHEHVISLEAVPTSGAAAAPEARVTGGLNAVTWSEAGYRYWALSDAEAGVVARFATAFRQATRNSG